MFIMDKIAFVSSNTSQLMFSSPDTLYDLFDSEGNNLGLEMWGENADNVAHQLFNTGKYTVEKINNWYRIMTLGDELPTPETIKLTENADLHVGYLTADKMFDKCCDLNDQKERFGLINDGSALTLYSDYGQFNVQTAYENNEIQYAYLKLSDTKNETKEMSLGTVNLTNNKLFIYDPGNIRINDWEKDPNGDDIYGYINEICSYDEQGGQITYESLQTNEYFAAIQFKNSETCEIKANYFYDPAHGNVFTSLKIIPK